MEEKKFDSKIRSHRIQNSVRGSISGIMLAAETTLVPFFIRTAMMRRMGAEYLGLHGLLQSACGVLNMTELGISSVMVYFLYEPVAVGDQKRVNACLMEMKRLYRRVACAVLAGGMLLMPFLEQLSSGEIPKGENIYLLFFCYVLAVAAQYLFWPEMASLLIVFQRTDLQCMIAGAVQFTAYGMQLAAVCIWHNYPAYVCMILLQAIVTGTVQKLVAGRLFSGCVPQGRLGKEERIQIRKKIFAMAGHQMDEKLLGSADSMYISAMLGLSAVAVYGNYYYVATAVSLLFQPVYQAVLSAIGNALVTESEKANKVRFDCLFFLGNMLAGWSSACMLCMYQTFMGLWMPGQLLPMEMVIWMCVYSYIMQMRKSVQVFKNAGGMWDSDKFKPYVSMAADLVLNLILIRSMGLQGAVLSTILCVGFLELPWETHVLYHDYFKMPASDYAKRFLAYSFWNAALCTVCFFVLKKMPLPDGLMALVIELSVCTAVSLCFYIIRYYRSREMKIWMDTLRIAAGDRGQHFRRHKKPGEMEDERKRK